MPASTMSLLADQSTDAQFRAWGSAVSGALGTLGLVQTADTGQINWTTVLAPNAANLVRGYEIWRFNDSLQATAPVFLKVEYGSGAATRCPQMFITVGTGSDGAGTITGTNISNVVGAVTTRRQVLPANTNQVPAATGTVFVNGDSGCLAMLAWPNVNIGSAWAGGLFIVERWRNWDGTNSGDGVTVLQSAGDGSSPQAWSQSICYLPNVMANPGAGTTMVTNGNVASAGLTPASAIIGTTLYPMPVLTGPGPRAGAPSQYVLATGLGDFPGATPITLTHYGVAHTWVGSGLGALIGTVGWGSWGAGNIKAFLFRTD